MWGIWSWAGPFYIFLIRPIIAINVLTRFDDISKIVETPNHQGYLHLAITGFLQYGLFILIAQHFGPEIGMLDWTYAQVIQLYWCAFIASLAVFYIPNLYPFPIRPAAFGDKGKTVVSAMVYPVGCLAFEALMWLILQALKGLF